MEKIYLKDYQSPRFFIEQVELEFDLYENRTIVTQVSQVIKNKEQASLENALFLNGEELKLIDIEVDGKTVKPELQKEGLTLTNVPDQFELKIITEIEPQNNKSFMGLYKSRALFCTQCEAEGFRKITYFVDRPDNMARFKTTLRADKTKYPTLLSNGNLIASKDLSDGRHECVWDDPSKKPAYLFALVAGDLEVLEDSFTTMNGRNVDLKIFVEKGRRERCHHAMLSLKKCMKWDEDVYGREYDLDIFMIVAVDDFNMGAMENKGLNIFNSKYILADSKTAEDKDYENIEAIVGHEYFHNWSGNRVTCRDWFQLSLKEGLTVYRDQEFTADMTSKPVKRIDDVNMLRARQFAEDGGPNAHAVRPAYCYSVDNFYTSTIYEKGAELIRMMATLLGSEGYRKGTDHYFEKHDEQAVTTDDFVTALSEANNNYDFSQFKNWYTQAGTPEVSVSENYNVDNNTYSLTLKQSCRATAESETKLPFHIPIRIGLIAQDGSEIKFSDGSTDQLIELKNSEQTFEFKEISEKPSLSFLRDFTAPINVNFEQTDAQLIHLMKFDSNDYNRWQSAQSLMAKYFNRIYKALIGGQPTTNLVEKSFLEAFKKAVTESSRDPLYFSHFIALPTQAYMKQFLTDIDPELVHKAFKILKKEIALFCETEFLNAYKSCSNHDPESVNIKDVGLRALAGNALSYLTATEKPKHIALAEKEYFAAQNMTEAQNALFSLNSTEYREKLTDDFFNKWKAYPIVINTWLKAQACSTHGNALARVKETMESEGFDKENPNKLYNTVGMFSGANPQFHKADGSGYEFVATEILTIDKKNPQVAARFASAFNDWKKLEPTRKELMKSQLERMANTKGLSKNTYELVTNALKA